MPEDGVRRSRKVDDARWTELKREERKFLQTDQTEVPSREVHEP